MLFKLLRSPFSSHSQAKSESRSVINHIIFIHIALEVVALLLSVHSLAPFTTHSTTIAIISSFFLLAFLLLSWNNNFSCEKKPFLLLPCFCFPLCWISPRVEVFSCHSILHVAYFCQCKMLCISNWRVFLEWIISHNKTRFNFWSAHNNSSVNMCMLLSLFFPSTVLCLQMYARCSPFAQLLCCCRKNMQSYCFGSWLDNFMNLVLLLPPFRIGWEAWRRSAVCFFEYVSRYLHSSLCCVMDMGCA